MVEFDLVKNTVININMNINPEYISNVVKNTVININMNISPEYISNVQKYDYYTKYIIK